MMWGRWRLVGATTAVAVLGVAQFAVSVAIGAGEEDDIEGPRHPHNVASEGIVMEPQIPIDGYGDEAPNTFVSPTLVAIISTISAVSGGTPPSPHPTSRAYRAAVGRRTRYVVSFFSLSVDWDCRWMA
jgi:hypothetical protein